MRRLLITFAFTLISAGRALNFQAKPTDLAEFGGTNRLKFLELANRKASRFSMSGSMPHGGIAIAHKSAKVLTTYKPMQSSTHDKAEKWVEIGCAHQRNARILNGPLRFANLFCRDTAIGQSPPQHLEACVFRFSNVLQYPRPIWRRTGAWPDAIVAKDRPSTWRPKKKIWVAIEASVKAAHSSLRWHQGSEINESVQSLAKSITLASLLVV